jgi:hypothetical protein
MTIDDPRSTLAAAGIGLERQGMERLRTLTEGERAFYRWILRTFGAGAPPSPDELADTASGLELEVEPALERLARADLVHHDPQTGAIVVAYPFSGRPTAHRVRLDGREVYAMCAIDALGIAPMLGEPIEIASRDPFTGESIQVWLDPDGNDARQPGEAVVVSGRTGSGESCDCCCPVLNFFGSSANAELWLAAHSEVEGAVTSMDEAIAAGRAVFGDILREA